MTPRPVLFVALAVLAVGCAGAAEVPQADPAPAPQAEPSAAAAPAAQAEPAPTVTPLILGEQFPAWTATTRTGAPVLVPDPSGGLVILELIRSADW